MPGRKTLKSRVGLMCKDAGDVRSHLYYIDKRKKSFYFAREYGPIHEDAQGVKRFTIDVTDPERCITLFAMNESFSLWLKDGLYSADWSQKILIGFSDGSR